MVEKIYYFIANGVNPYENLAVEEILLDQVQPGECILYLWQNQNTVVIGRNQNCWKECKVNELEESGGFLARRLSGGGAVYHDLGNLNFTFLTTEQDYSVEKQLFVIQKAVEKFGITVEKSGRNDLTVKGRKFSGNAFYRSRGKCYHHGTILISTDEKMMENFLNVDPSKLKSKGVDSVRSRVGNLCEYSSEISVGSTMQNLIFAFSDVYQKCPKRILSEELPGGQVQLMREKYESWEWKYGKKIDFTHQFTKRFSWGSIEFQIQVDQGRIQSVNVFSDGLDSRFYCLETYLVNTKYERKEILNTLKNSMEKQEFENSVIQDILELVRQNIE